MCFENSKLDQMLKDQDKKVTLSHKIKNNNKINKQLTASNAAFQSLGVE